MHFDIYDFEGVGKVDACRLGDLLRSLDLRPTNVAIEKAGGTKKKGELLLISHPPCSFLLTFIFFYIHLILVKRREAINLRRVFANLQPSEKG